MNDQLKARNASLDEEVRDLKQGYGAIEERARSELGMVKQDEVFIQVDDEVRTMTDEEYAKFINQQINAQPIP